MSRCWRRLWLALGYLRLCLLQLLGSRAVRNLRRNFFRLKNSGASHACNMSHTRVCTFIGINVSIGVHSYHGSKAHMTMSAWLYDVPKWHRRVATKWGPQTRAIFLGEHNSNFTRLEKVLHYSIHEVYEPLQTTSSVAFEASHSKKSTCSNRALLPVPLSCGSRCFSRGWHVCCISCQGDLPAQVSWHRRVSTNIGWDIRSI